MTRPTKIVHVVGQDPLVVELTDEEIVAMEAEWAAQPPRLIAKSLVLERLTDEQLETALSLMSVRQKERWRMPGKPDIYVNDPELLGLLQAIGADAETVLA